MNPPLPASPPDSPTRSAQRQLEENRAQMAHWLEQDQQDRSRLSPLDRAVRVALPLLTGEKGSPGGAMVLGALAQSWWRSSLPVSSQPIALSPLDLMVTLVRRHPKTALLLVSAAGLALYAWSRPPGDPPVRTPPP